MLLLMYNVYLDVVVELDVDVIIEVDLDVVDVDLIGVNVVKIP